MSYPRGTDTQSLVFEIVLTSLLVLVVLGAATQHRLLGPDAALPTTATIAAGGLVGIPVSGASMNPARSLAPALINDRWAHQWIYILDHSRRHPRVLLTYLLRGAQRSDEHEAAQGEQNT